MIHFIGQRSRKLQASYKRKEKNKEKETRKKHADGFAGVKNSGCGMRDARGFSDIGIYADGYRVTRVLYGRVRLEDTAISKSVL